MFVLYEEETKSKFQLHICKLEDLPRGHSIIEKSPDRSVLINLSKGYEIGHKVGVERGIQLCKRQLRQQGFVVED